MDFALRATQSRGVENNRVFDSFLKYHFANRENKARVQNPEWQLHGRFGR